jgi:xanthine/CO dehydrogenase XdhC/CoxF family maturation factor
MTETQAIIDSYQRARAENVRGALATVVRVEGSAYRRPSARMFITETGQATGVVSGGCLERDVCERAANVMRTGEPIIVTYDTTSDNDIVWGLGIGCNGVIEVLIEPAGNDCMDDLMTLLAECSKSRRRGALATVIHQEGETKATIGTRALFYPSGLIGGVVISPNIFDDLRDTLKNGASTIKRCEVDGGSIEVFIEIIEPQVPLVIFGAGDDVLPILAFARNLGWHTTIVDTRARPASIERFREADAVLLSRPEAVSGNLALTESSAVVLMTHNYLHDLELLKLLLCRRVRYLGCLGPKRRTERLLVELSGGAVAAADAYLRQVHAPAGLDIGAETPSEIAFSIIAEVKAILTGREGGLLRDRKGSIHGEVSSDLVSSTPSVGMNMSFTDGVQTRAAVLRGQYHHAVAGGSAVCDLSRS